MGDTEVSKVTHTQNSQQITTSREQSFNWDEEQSACLTLFTSPFSSDRNNTILSTEDEYLKQVCYELMDKDVYIGASENPAASSVSSPELLDALDNPSLNLNRTRLANINLILMPPNGFGYWEWEGNTERKYRKLAENMGKATLLQGNECGHLFSSQSPQTYPESLPVADDS
ncbi:hypothetical protein RhiXN_11609 [Rhizoctonia solani]|uniref:Uncharacterized protein n=1 Tax=Rhizoctonia solani TaxID=456999 RepID=A0A8H8P5I7_9AGAM|nr:uncharacterized protein RhiXN_11609 [Rhizoctonia solani]QRW24697.1 hypothetical protein RhiXN_11609 [Rhizoctonia solani]